MSKSLVGECGEIATGILGSSLRHKDNATPAEVGDYVTLMKEARERLKQLVPLAVEQSKEYIPRFSTESTVDGMDPKTVDILIHARGEFGRTKREQFSKRVDFFGHTMSNFLAELDTVIGAYESGDFSPWTKNVNYGSQEVAKTRVVTSIGHYLGEEGLRDSVRYLESSLGEISQSSVDSQLEKLFAGKLDERTLEGLIKNVDAEMQRVTLQTGSTGVVSFRAQDKKGYGKVSSNLSALQNEHNALNAIGKDGLARILAPVPIGLVMGDSSGALFTWGTENKSLYNPEDVRDYTALFNTLLFQYAERSGQNLRELARDPRVQDVFNLALIHTSLKDFKSVHPRPSIIGLEELEERAGTDLQALTQLREYNPICQEAIKRAGDLNPGQKVFIHGDERPENIGRDPFSIRPLVDWANARMGSAVESLASLESEDSGKYLGWYNFVSNLRGGVKLDGDSQNLLYCHDVLQPYRTASFKIGKGRVQEAQRDISRLRKNSQKYTEHFR